MPGSPARFSRPVLCLMILSVVFNIVVSSLCDGCAPPSKRSTIISFKRCAVPIPARREGGGVRSHHARQGSSACSISTTPRMTRPGFSGLSEPPSAASSTSLYAPLRSTLPPVFDGVEPPAPRNPRRAPPAARRPRCRWQSHRIPRQRRTDRVRHLPRHLTPMARAGLAARLQARCKPVARRMHGPCKAPASAAIGQITVARPLSGSRDNRPEPVANPCKQTV